MFRQTIETIFSIAGSLVKPYARIHPFKQRALRCETLEVRRLLVAEGETFSLTQTVDATGLLGNVSAQVRWGDGSQTAAVVSAQPDNGKLKVRFDTSLDTSGFFKGANASRLTLLQQAADAVVRQFADDLDAITPNPGQKLEWNAQFLNPSTGLSTTDSRGQALINEVKNIPVAANELVIFVGARDLAGNERGRGGPGGYGFPNPGLLPVDEIAKIEAFREVVKYRGEIGAEAARATDFGPWGGSIAFDNNGTNWYFGKEIDGIKPNETDFVTVAMHELVHALGFGRSGINNSWDTVSTASSFTGPKATAAYLGTGNPPLEQGFHWGASILTASNQPTLMREQLKDGERQPLTPLDIAALDDIGWTVANSRISVTADHIYGDDGTFPVEIVLRGSTLGQIVVPFRDASITDVKPTLTVPANQTVTVGTPLNLSDIGAISDPGFGSPLSDPVQTEKFTYSINWGDGSTPDTGDATQDQAGNASRPTLASFNGSHTYDKVGNYTVRVRIQDTETTAAFAEKTFTVAVTAPPKLSLALTKTTIDENAGSAASELTITRSGPASASPLTVQLKSEDTSEVTVPATATIAANATSVTVPINAVDDALLDGNQVVVLNATGSNVESGTINVTVKDIETITAAFTSATVAEDQPNVVKIRITRSNTDVSTPLSVGISGGSASQLRIEGTPIIPANQKDVLLDLNPVNDTDPEPTQVALYTFTAAGYEPGKATIALLDDEPPFFQNQNNRFDIDGKGTVTAADALAIINELQFYIGAASLDPKIDKIVNDFHFDANGDYLITALDALVVINELNRLLPQGNSEQVQAIDTAMSQIQFVTSQDDEEDERGNLF